MDKETNQIFQLALQKLDNIEKRFDNVEKRFDNVEKRQDEIYNVVKAIEHSNNVRKAEIDNLTHKVAHIEGTVNGVGELIENRRSIK
ncbi:M domain protein [Clostridium sp. AWRP]|uniref:M domain protein n=1 Tax=Clostridium sp. AWRP TaxID=2212991 RepID=UPI000FDA4FCB|nr:M domain protein [Clostridium sp. AWRP]AZV55489.1 M domain protein [Clostridium sp. AWRP]